mmetsp:Transcript_88141/g.128848  ORF Transcript_88141/g.128848 Transcript_88141/m.128848 type:complete len:159 (-) Transcript_88141:2612-3088(-)
MPVSTRGVSYEPTTMELATQERDQRLYDRTSSIDALCLAEKDDDNVAYGVVYTAEILRLMLLAYSDEYGKIRPCHKTRVRQLFRDRCAWELGTLFRTVWCTITMLQVGQRCKDGWTGEQIDQHNMDPSSPSPNLFALLFQVWSKCVCSAKFTQHCAVL